MSRASKRVRVPPQRAAPRIGLWLFAFTLGVYVLADRGPTAADDLIHLQACEALATRDTLAFSRATYDPAAKPLLRFFFREGVGGRVYAGLPPGLAVASAPLCLAALSVAGPAAGATVRRLRFGAEGPETLEALRRDPLARAAGLVNPLAAASLVLLFFLYARDRDARPEHAVGAALVLGFGTFLWSYAESYWTQPLALALLFGGFVALRRYALAGGSAAQGLLAGALLGATALVRYEAPLLATVVLGAGVVSLAQRQEGRRIAPPLFGFALPLVALLVWNLVRFGRPFETGSPHGSLAALLAGAPARLLVSLPANLVSPNQGLLVFAPPLAVAAVVAWRARRRLDLFERAGLGIGVLALLFYSAFTMWETAGSWGPRFLVPALPFLLLPAVGHAGTPSRRWLYGAGLLGALVQLPGLLVLPEHATSQTLRYFSAGTLDFLLRSELLVDGRRVLAGAVDPFWWSGSRAAALTGMLVLAATLASAALGWRAMRRAPASASPLRYDGHPTQRPEP